MKSLKQKRDQKSEVNYLWNLFSLRWLDTLFSFVLHIFQLLSFIRSNLASWWAQKTIFRSVEFHLLIASPLSSIRDIGKVWNLSDLMSFEKTNVIPLLCDNWNVQSLWPKWENWERNVKSPKEDYDGLTNQLFVYFNNFFTIWTFSPCNSCKNSHSWWLQKCVNILIDHQVLKGLQVPAQFLWILFNVVIIARCHNILEKFYVNVQLLLMLFVLCATEKNFFIGKSTLQKSWNWMWSRLWHVAIVSEIVIKRLQVASLMSSSSINLFN